MRKSEKIMLVVAMLSAISLAILSLHLSTRMNERDMLISQLNSSLDKSDAQLQNTRHVIRMIIKDIQSQDKFDNEQAYSSYKTRVSGLLEANINTIISDRPLQGGNWFLNKVGFISPSFVVVEYEDGHELYMTLIQILQTDKGFSFTIVDY